MLLYLNGVTVSFDGFKALNELSLVVEEGELRTIIGPNGAGKTTMMDVVTGKTRPDSGEVFFRGNDGSDPARRGGDRQSRHRPQVPAADRVREPDRVRKPRTGAEPTPRGTWRTLFAALTREQRDRIAATLERIGLAEREREPAGALSHGQKQWLEIGMLLIHDRQLLLLDEPVAGMTDRETEETAELILDLARDRTIVVVEHDMAFVRSLGAKRDGAARGLGARRRLDRARAEPSRASSKSISGAERLPRYGKAWCAGMTAQFDRKPRTPISRPAPRRYPIISHRSAAA